MSNLPLPEQPTAAEHPRLSLSMIVRDESERIDAALASVAGFVDEMVGARHRLQRRHGGDR